MKTINQIRERIRGREMAYVLARKDATKFGHAGLSASLGELIGEDAAILDEIDKIVAEAAKRRREIRNTIIMAILGALVALAAAILW